MTTWTLRLVAFAGLLALLGRLPALDSVADAFFVGVVVSGLGLTAVYGPVAVRAVRAARRVPFALAHRLPSLTPRFRSTHGVDA